MKYRGFLAKVIAFVIIMSPWFCKAAERYPVPPPQAVKTKINVGIPFHFLLLSAGEYLKFNSAISPKDLKGFVESNEMFRGKITPISDCALALRLLCDCGFLKVSSINIEYKDDMMELSYYVKD